MAVRTAAGVFPQGVFSEGVFPQGVVPVINGTAKLEPRSMLCGMGLGGRRGVRSQLLIVVGTGQWDRHFSRTPCSQCGGLGGRRGVCKVYVLLTCGLIRGTAKPHSSDCMHALSEGDRWEGLPHCCTVG